MMATRLDSLLHTLNSNKPRDFINLADTQTGKHITKINRKGKSQDIIILLTDADVYNITPDNFKVKRIIPLNSITGISVANDSDEFVLHVNDQHDYCLKTERRTLFLTALEAAKSRKDPEHALQIFQKNSVNLISNFIKKSNSKTDQVDFHVGVSFSEAKLFEERGSKSMMGTTILRQLVGKKKNRYVEDGYDLDLTYITPNVIAMSFPYDDVEGNSKNSVYRFLEDKHRDHYKIYNLCSENRYDPAIFHNRVANYPFDEHSCPNFKLIIDFCLDVMNWISEDEQNIAVVHCRNGKNRTGLMTSCFLLYSNQFSVSEDAIAFFGNRRAQDGRGVTNPSQIRYVKYFENYAAEKMLSASSKSIPVANLILTKITFSSCPKFDSSGSCSPYFKVYRTNGRSLYDSRTVTKPKKIDLAEKTFDLICDLKLRGDIKFVFYHEDPYSFDASMFEFWINTAFIENGALVLGKNELDRAVKDKNCKRFEDGFQVELSFKADDGAVRSDDLSSDDFSVVRVCDMNLEGLRHKLRGIEEEIELERRKCLSLGCQYEEICEENDQLLVELESLRKFK
jgi:phosphatidylinositol-3,4,5-trisphosphate 3-phosphatase/dual-specificity protein phosphatase PTEN